MATKKNALYKKEQRLARESKYRIRPIWGFLVEPGTKTCRDTQAITRGKAMIKAEKRLSHRKGFYREQRILTIWLSADFSSYKQREATV